MSAVSMMVACERPSVAGPREVEATPQELLFRDLLDKTLRRSAFSPYKARAFGAGDQSTRDFIRAELTATLPAFQEARTDAELYEALLQFNNARHDQHLRLTPAEGGISNAASMRGGDVAVAPIKVRVDYSDPKQPFLFVSDLDARPRLWPESVVPAVGDKLLTINGRTVRERLKQVERYIGASTPQALWWAFALGAMARIPLFRSEIYPDDGLLHLQLERVGGATYTVSLPYLSYSSIVWGETDSHDFWGTKEQQRARHHEPYAGFGRAFSTNTFDLFAPRDERKVLILRWHRFSGSLIEDVLQLLEYARANNAFAYGLIWDATHSTGGSGGAWALQRLQSQRFRETFGNIRISDLTSGFLDALEDYVRQQMAESDKKPRDPAHGPYPDPGAYLLDWIQTVARPALRRGDHWTPNVPFKSIMQPKDGDGWLEPAPEHFTGPLVLLLSPHGCSHVDQLAAMVIDNQLGHSIGMPAGGCSNTWEWGEVVTMPGSGRPLVEMTWTIGQTVRPNGEVLEGNPALVVEHVPLTRGSYRAWERDLLRRALRYLHLQGR